MVVGLSDASTWNLSAGIKADPSVIHGAFADQSGPYQVLQEGEQLVFQNDLGIKKYYLTPDGLAFEYQSGMPTPWEIPMVLDPWMRFEKDWAEGYQVAASTDGFQISVGAGFQVEIESSSDFRSHSFTATRDRLGRTENPNDEYPPGHYLPYPLVLIEMDSFQDGHVEFKLIDR